ncbi:MAG: hypothetical protein Q9159_004079 [Coniocarpon cinnabarinum]
MYSESLSTQIRRDLSTVSLDTKKRQKQSLERSAAIFKRQVPTTYHALYSALAAGNIRLITREHIVKGKQLGSGATMTVYKGEWDHCPVALKYLNVELSMEHQPQSGAAFHSMMAGAMLEVRVLSHELLRYNQAIVRLLAVTFENIEKDGAVIGVRPILVVELADLIDEKPLTLGRLVKSHSLEMTEKVTLAQDIALGLSALHDIGIVHSDLKPDNILLFRDAATGKLRAKLSDFGFCWIYDDENPHPGLTPYWAAPEQLQCPPKESEAQNRSTRTSRDNYSFALLLWYLLIEERPLDELDYEIRQAKFEDRLQDLFDLSFGEYFQVRLSGDEVRRVLPSFSEAMQMSMRQWDVRLSKRKQPVEFLRFAEEVCWRKRTQSWSPMLSPHHHVFRYFIKFNLALDPNLRIFEPQTLLNMLQSMRLQEAMAQQYLTPMSWESVSDYMKDLRGFVALRDARCEDFKLYEKLLQESPIRKTTRTRQHPLQQSGNPFSNQFIRNVPVIEKKHQFRLQRSLALDPNCEDRAQCMYVVAECYMQAWGIEKSYPKAMHWFEQAARLGHRSSIIELTIKSHRTRSWPTSVDWEQKVEWIIRTLLWEAPFNVHEDAWQRIRRVVDANTFLCLEAALSTLLENRARVNSTVNGVYGYNSFKGQAWKDILNAVQDDDVDMLQQTLDQHPHFLKHNPSNPQATLLNFAAAKGCPGIVEILIDQYDMPLNSLDEFGMTPIVCAINALRSDTFQVLDNKIDGSTTKEQSSLAHEMLLKCTICSQGAMMNACEAVGPHDVTTNLAKYRVWEPCLYILPCLLPTVAPVERLRRRGS